MELYGLYEDLYLYDHAYFKPCTMLDVMYKQEEVMVPVYRRNVVSSAGWPWWTWTAALWGRGRCCTVWWGKLLAVISAQDTLCVSFYSLYIHLAPTPPSFSMRGGFSN